jgi:deleted-in-malignant-brain-tumors protein 1
VLVNGAWGTVCDDSFDNNDAAVVCRELGFVGGSPTHTEHNRAGDMYGEGSGDIMYDQVQCTGSEASLASCTKLVNNHDCGHHEDVGVNCKSATSGVRLAGGAGAHEGTVQVWVNSRQAWGTVCDDRWDSNDAAVVCRQLGFSGGTAHTNAHFGAGSGDIMYDEVNCDGNEANLASCPRAVGGHDCQHREDAGVTCTY